MVPLSKPYLCRNRIKLQEKVTSMKKETSNIGYCIKSGDQFVTEWIEPQFTSYYLSGFDNVHIFRTKQEAEKEQGKFPLSEIKPVRKTISIELLDE